MISVLKFFGALALCSVAVISAFGQGQIIFDNRVSATVVAPIYGLESGQPGVSKRGNTSTGVPAGTQTYAGPLLSGTDYTAQLFAGPTNAAPENLGSTQPLVRFGTGVRAGFVVAPTFAVTIPGVAEDQPALVQLRVWNNRAGSVTNWQQVLADPGIERGESAPFVSPPLGGLFRPPPNLIGLQSFNLALPPIQQFLLRIQLTNGAPALDLFAPLGKSYRINYRSSFADPAGWAELTNFVLASSPYHVIDAPPTNASTRFYRAEMLP